MEVRVAMKFVLCHFSSYGQRIRQAWKEVRCAGSTTRLGYTAELNLGMHGKVRE